MINFRSLWFTLIYIFLISEVGNIYSILMTNRSHLYIIFGFNLFIFWWIKNQIQAYSAYWDTLQSKQFLDMRNILQRSSYINKTILQISQWVDILFLLLLHQFPSCVSYICCKPFPWFSRITLLAWRCEADYVICLDIPIRHGYFVFRVVFPPP